MNKKWPFTIVFVSLLDKLLKKSATPSSLTGHITDEICSS